MLEMFFILIIVVSVVGFIEMLNSGVEFILFVFVNLVFVKLLKGVFK